MGCGLPPVLRSTFDYWERGEDGSGGDSSRDRAMTCATIVHADTLP